MTTIPEAYATAVKHFQAGDLRQALRLVPGYAEAHLNLSIALFSGGRIQEAITHCDMAQKLGYRPPADFRRLLAPYRGFRAQPKRTDN